MYMLWMSTINLVQPARLMRELTNGLGTGSSLAIAYKLLSCADRSERLAALGTWRLDGPSFFLGLCTGVILFFLIELWFTAKWCVLRWTDRGYE